MLPSKSPRGLSATWLVAIAVASAVFGKDVVQTVLSALSAATGAYN